MGGWMLKRTRLIAVGLAALALLGAQAGSLDITPSLVAVPSLNDLRGVDELKGLFNKDVGKIRLVLLVSPT